MSRQRLFRLFFLLSLAFSVVLAGCGKDEPTAAPTPIQSVSKDASVQTGFYVVGMGSNSVDGQTVLELTVSEPLATAQDFNQVMSVTDATGKTVDGGWSQDYDDPRIVRFSPVQAGADYKVLVSKELLSQSGAQFSADVTESITGVEQAPTFGFSGQGSLLPARATEGLPIRTINVSELDVEFLRVKDAYVSEAIRERAFRGNQYGWYLNRLSRIAESVYSNRFEITEKKRNNQVLSLLPIQKIPELKRSGLYYAIMRRPGSFDSQFEVTHYVVSDIAVHVRRYQNQALVLTRSLSTGAALTNVKLELLDKNGVTELVGESNSDGQAILSLAPSAEMVLIAQAGEEMSVLPFNQPALDLSEYPISGSTAGAQSIHIWSGRDLYRPGEELKFSALLRDFDGKSVPDQPVFALLSQPDGKLYAAIELKPSALGYMEFSRVVPADAPTGRWKLEMSTDPEGKARRHAFNFRVEEFLPERLKLDLNTEQARLKPSEVLNLEVAGAYLYGAPAGGNRFVAKYVLSADTEAVPALKGYLFGDQVNKPKSEQIDAVDQNLDAEGKLSARIEVAADQVNGPISLAVVGQLFETGGRAITRVLKRSIWPAEQLVGVRPMFSDNDAGGNSLARFELTRADATGALHGGRIEVKLVRERRDYRWSYRSGLGWVSDFTESLTESDSEVIALDGKASAKVEFPVEWGNYRLEVTDVETKLVTRYPFYAGWSWGNTNTGGDARPDKIKLALDKSSYKVGDRVSLTVTPPETGPALLMVESGELLETREFIAEKTTTLELEVKPEWNRHDVYISAMVFKAGDNRNHITPKRALGMIHLPMDRADRQLKVELNAPAKIQPNTDLAVAVSVPSLAGKQAFVTVHAVDQGITNITNFSVPDPFKNFFAQRAYAIDLFDVYGKVIESLPGALAKLRYGGDGMLGELPQAKRQTAKVLTVDLFSGAVTLDAKGVANVPLAVPDFNGSLKVSAVVFSADSYGLSQQETIVRAPIVVEASLPRVMAPDDRSKLTLDIQNFTEKAGDFTVRVASSELMKLTGAERSLRLADQEKQTLSFDMNAVGSGIAKLTLTVSGNGKQLSREFETVVRPAWGETRKVRFDTVQAASNISLSNETAEFFPSTVRSRISVSAQAPIPVADAMKGLFEYPYGCIEQTTSKLLPYVTLDDVALAKLGLPTSTVKDRAENVSFALGRIASMQASSGHFNYWPGSDYPEPTLTPFVAEVLVDAQSQGYAMPPMVVQKALERLKESVLSGGEVNYDRVYNNNADHLQLGYIAHAGYVLSKLNQAPLGSLRSAFDTKAQFALSPLPLVRLGVALKNAGDAKRAQEAFDLAFGEKWSMTRDLWLGDYGSELRDHALSLALAIEADAAPADLSDRLLELSYLMREQRFLYLSTQERVAMVRLAKDLSQGNQGLNGSLNVGGQAKTFATRGIFAAELSLADIQSGATLSLVQGPAYVLQQTAGISKQAPQPSSTDITIARSYFTMDGKRFEGNSIAEGERLIVRIDIDSKVWASDMLMVDLMPGGLEAENLNLLPPEQLSGLSVDGENIAEARAQVTVRNEEFRDDRYALALPLNQGKVRFYYLVRAVSPGSYVVPPPSLEDMYRPTLSTVGVSIPARLTVLDGQ